MTRNLIRAMAFCPLLSGITTAPVGAQSCSDPFVGGITTLAEGEFYREVVGLDIDGDGDQDVAVTFEDRIDSIAVLRNDGQGSLSLAPTDVYELVTSIDGMCAADWNGDGSLDLLFGSLFDGTVEVMLNDGTGMLDGPNELIRDVGNTRDIQADHFNAEGAFDAVVLSDGTGSNRAVVMINDGRGSVARTIDLPLNDNPTEVRVSDFNGDGYNDIAAVARFGGGGKLGTVTVYFGDGRGGFDSGTTYAVGELADAMDVGDVDNDGDTDIVVNGGTKSGLDEIRVLLNDGTGDFPDFVSIAANIAKKIRLGDFTGDCNLDVAYITVTAEFGAIRILAGPLTRDFEGAGFYPIADDQIPCMFGTGTLNNDPLPDLIAGSCFDNEIIVLLNTCCAGDFDGDGIIGPADLAALLAVWGSCKGCPGDLTDDSIVDAADLALLLSAWGPCLCADTSG